MKFKSENLTKKDGLEIPSVDQERIQIFWDPKLIKFWGPYL